MLFMHEACVTSALLPVQKIGLARWWRPTAAVMCQGDAWSWCASTFDVPRLGFAPPCALTLIRRSMCWWLCKQTGSITLLSTLHLCPG